MKSPYRQLTAGILGCGLVLSIGATARAQYNRNPQNDRHHQNCPCCPYPGGRGTSERVLPNTRPGSERVLPNTRPLPVGTPLPETVTSPVATVTPANGTIDVKLQNTTNAVVSYQVIGHTADRYLPGGNQTTLLNLPLPVTITLVREDDGLLRVLPIESPDSPAEMLEVQIDEEIRFDDVQGVIRVQRNGGVYVY